MRARGFKGRAAGSSDMLTESMALCDQVIKELRTLSYLLHPPLLDEAGLVPALQWYVRGFVERSGINVEIVVLEDIGRIPSDAEMALFRIVQESLTNIHRHSGCRSALIWVTKDDGEVIVRIQDDGHGMPERLADGSTIGQTNGVGILGMRQRLKQLGGRLEIESDSQGTTVTARAPISRGDYIAYSCGR
jgi:signal transduction histidine kinase